MPDKVTARAKSAKSSAANQALPEQSQAENLQAEALYNFYAKKKDKLLGICKNSPPDRRKILSHLAGEVADNYSLPPGLRQAFFQARMSKNEEMERLQAQERSLFNLGLDILGQACPHLDQASLALRLELAASLMEGVRSRLLPQYDASSLELIKLCCSMLEALFPAEEEKEKPRQV